MGMEGYLLLFHGVEQSKRREGKELILSSSSESAKRDENPTRSKEETDKDEWKKRPRSREKRGKEKQQVCQKSEDVHTHTHQKRGGERRNEGTQIIDADTQGKGRIEK